MSVIPTTKHSYLSELTLCLKTHKATLGSSSATSGMIQKHLSEQEKDTRDDTRLTSF